jgi:hypothetical protein
MADTEPEAAPLLEAVHEPAFVPDEKPAKGSKAKRSRGNRPSPLAMVRALSGRISRLQVLVAGAVVVVLLAVGAGGWAVFRGIPPLLHIPGLGPGPQAKSSPNAPAAKPAAVAKKPVEQKPEPLPSGAPEIGPDFEPKLAFPFARRLHQVNLLARKRIVTDAELHKSDAGQLYYTAVVTSCKDLEALWSIRKGVLDRKVQQPLRLKTDFPIFAFVQHDSVGQWGVIACDDTV